MPISKIKSRILGVIGLSLAIISPFTTEIFNPHASIGIGVFGGFMMFALILETPALRVTKGMALIAFGVIFQTFYPKLFFIFITQSNPLYNELYEQLNLYTQVILLAGSGAGGSIIANYTDRNSSDYEYPTPPTTRDHTQEIKELIAITKKINDRSNLIIILSISTFSLGLTSLFLTFLK